ncbi:MAG: cystathionine gamma-synthase [Sphingobacteriales bacterium]|nr:cystathionine gamma-synthase [Sphingobacteriales bacterium]
MKFATKVIHAGIEPDATSGAIMTPIFQTSTYVQDEPGVHKGFEYARTQNPTRNVLQNQLAALENGNHGICFASGLAATDAIVKLFQQGDHIISCNDLYGGTYRIFTKVYGKFGMDFSFVDMTDVTNIENAITPKTKLIWVETPTNPMLNIVDIAAVCALAKKHNLLVCVDNTFASPYLQTPLDLGADIVIHSATKYLGGHSDVIHGAVVVKDKSLADQLYFIQNASGAVPGPQDCFLILRGIKTLHIRVERACENAEKIAAYLKSNPKVGNVHYPGFTEHKGHEIAKKQMKKFGAMVSFSLKDDSLAAAHKVLSSTKLFSLAESLGGVESLIGHPASMTHGSIPLAERQKTGVVDSLIRLSIGIEDADDLIEDLKNAIG